MKSYTIVKLIAVSSENFEDNTGTEVEYFKNYIKDADGSVDTINSKTDFSACEGKTGIAEIGVYDDPRRGRRLSLRSFWPDKTFSIPEKADIEA